jgi:hypothetical protein
MKWVSSQTNFKDRRVFTKKQNGPNQSGRGQ